MRRQWLSRAELGDIFMDVTLKMANGILKPLNTTPMQVTGSL